MTKNHGRPDDPEGAQREPRGEQRSRAERPPLVSVVVPCYNQARFLGEAIESVLAQSHPLFEVVVVDDGSTDDTSEVAARYPGVRLVRQENRGLSGARNAGLARSRGEYVVFLDADDRLLPGALEAGVERLEARPACALVAGRDRHIAADGSPLPTSGQGLHRAHVEGDHYLGLLYYSVWIPGAVMFRRAVFESVGAFDPSVNGAADYDLYLRIARRFPVHYHGELVLEYRRHDTNMTRDSAPMLKATVSVLRAQRGHLKGTPRYEQAYKAGMRTGQVIYGVPLANEARRLVRQRQWKRVVRSALVLLRYYPQGLLILLSERRSLAVRLRIRQQELQARKRQLRLHERRLQALYEQPGHREQQRRVEELEGALAEERREVQRLEGRTQHLRLRIQRLDRRRARNGRAPGVRKLLRRLGRARARMLGR
jgi:glycosyltransferase involved in cell wall biosynthesis